MTASKKIIQAAAGNAAGGDFYSYTIDNSVRFNPGDSPYLSRSSYSCSRTTWTVSFWLKRSDNPETGTYNYIFDQGTTSGTGNQQTYFYQRQLTANYDYVAPTSFYATQADYIRDLSAWYHFVLVWDSTNATSTDRIRIYKNGVRSNLSASAMPSQNHQGQVGNSAYPFYIGRYSYSIQYNLDGYLADWHFIDGQALDSSYFGETKNGVWIPKSYSGTYSGNSYHLDFADSSDLGKDVSGNANHFTSSGLTSSDQMTDTPTNNFATLNPLTNIGYITPGRSNGNLQNFDSSGTGYSFCLSTMMIDVEDADGWYFEVTRNAGDADSNKYMIGIMSEAEYIAKPGNTGLFALSGGYARWDGDTLGNADIYNGNTLLETVTGGTQANNDVMMVCVKNGKIWWGINGTWDTSGSPDPETETSPSYSGLTGNYIPTISGYNNSGVYGWNVTINFGQSSFTYTPPTGTKALCTANLPEPTIGPNSATQSDENFAPVLYTGNGTAIGSGGKTISDLEFQPDFTWIKNRDATDNHMLFDAVRTATKYLSSNLTNAEATDTESLTSFTSTGFTLGNNVAVNTNTEDYVAWNWKANGSGVSNTDGTITSTVSANTDAGFSIVTYTGTGVESAETIGHGLGVAPKVVITKSRDATPAYNWNTYHYGVDASAPEDWFVALNNNAARVSYTAADIWNRTQPTSSVVHVNSILASGGSSDRIVFYCFAEVEGFSKFGKYTGNGSTDGPFVYTGFRPAWVLLKRTDSATGGSWSIRDSARNPENPIDVVLYTDGTNADADWSSYPVDLLSNGFKIRASNTGQNASGSPYIFMAFAEMPFRYSNAR